jgi:hypothetical protein
MAGKSLADFIAATPGGDTPENRAILDLARAGKHSQAQELFLSQGRMCDITFLHALYHDWTHADPQGALAGIDAAAGQASLAAEGWARGLADMPGTEPQRLVPLAMATVKNASAATAILHTASYAWITNGRTSAMDLVRWWRDAADQRAAAGLQPMQGTAAETFGRAVIMAGHMQAGGIITRDQLDLIVRQNLEVIRYLHATPEGDRALGGLSRDLGYIAIPDPSRLPLLDAYTLPQEPELKANFLNTIGISLGQSIIRTSQPGAPPAAVAAGLVDGTGAARPWAAEVWSGYTGTWARGQPSLAAAIAELAATPLPPEVHQPGVERLVLAASALGQADDLMARLDALPAGEVREIYRRELRQRMATQAAGRR